MFVVEKEKIYLCVCVCCCRQVAGSNQLLQVSVLLPFLLLIAVYCRTELWRIEVRPKIPHSEYFEYKMKMMQKFTTRLDRICNWQELDLSVFHKLSWSWNEGSICVNSYLPCSSKTIAVYDAASNCL